MENIKNLLMPLFLRKGCFPVDFQEEKRPLRTKSVQRPIKVGKRPINEGKRPIKAKVLVGVSVGSFMGCFRAPPPWRKTAPLKRPIKRSTRIEEMSHPEHFQNQNRTIASNFRLRRSQIARNPAERRGFGLRNCSLKSQIASDFPLHP